MKKKNKKVTLLKRTFIVGALLALLTYHCIDYQYQPTYEILDECDEAFARYSKGKIYIGSKKYLSNLKNVNEDDILVEDLRDTENPDFKIHNSYLITDRNIRNEILVVLCEYEKCYPSNWDRTIESMRLEWLAHNLSYIFNYEQHRTMDVDLDNNDEIYYNNKVLQKVLKYR